jgi:hypothetical protein
MSTDERYNQCGDYARVNGSSALFAIEDQELNPDS